MAITDRSQIPLRPSDFRVLNGERRLSDVRLAERLAHTRLRTIRQVIKDWRSFLEEKSGKPLAMTAVSRARGPAGEGFWLTIPELIFIAAQSKAKNAPEVVYEAATIAAAWLKGEQLPADEAPTLRALTAPDLPRVVSEPNKPPTIEPVRPARVRRPSDQAELALEPNAPTIASEQAYHDADSDNRFSLVRGYNTAGDLVQLVFKEQSRRISLRFLCKLDVCNEQTGAKVAVYCDPMVRVDALLRLINRCCEHELTPMMAETIRHYFADVVSRNQVRNERFLDAIAEPGHTPDYDAQ
jgi:hypothetical protein